MIFVEIMFTNLLPDYEKFILIEFVQNIEESSWFNSQKDPELAEIIEGIKINASKPSFE